MVRNLLRAALALACFTASPAIAAEDLSGTWVVAAPVTALKTADGQTPPLNAEGQRIYSEHLAATARGDRSWDSSAICKPLGPQRALVEMEWPFELMQSDGRIDFLHQWNRLNRSILITDKQPEPFNGPYFMGQSIGRWDGDALVIDLIGQDGRTVLDPSGLPHSDDMTAQEHWRLTDGGNTLEVRMTITDPEFYSRPWDAVLTFKRAPAGTRIAEDVCFERVDTGDKYYTIANGLDPLK